MSFYVTSQETIHCLSFSSFLEYYFSFILLFSICSVIWQEKNNNDKSNSIIILLFIFFCNHTISFSPVSIFCFGKMRYFPERCSLFLFYFLILQSTIITVSVFKNKCVLSTLVSEYLLRFFWKISVFLCEAKHQKCFCF